MYNKIKLKGRNMKKIIVLLTLLTLLIAGCTNAKDTNDTKISEQPKEEQTAEENNKETTDTEESISTDKNDVVIAPDFELESIDGTKIKLSDLRDKNVIVNFWATWCGFCVEEMPDLQKLQETYKDDDLLILAVNVGETKEEVEKFMKENNIDLTVLLDKDSSVANIYGLRSFPSTLAINKKGEVVSGYVGMLTYEQMELLYKYFK